MENKTEEEMYIRISFGGPMHLPKVTATDGLREKEFAIASRLLWAVADEHLKEQAREHR